MRAGARRGRLACLARLGALPVAVPAALALALGACAAPVPPLAAAAPGAQPEVARVAPPDRLRAIHDDALAVQAEADRAVVVALADPRMADPRMDDVRIGVPRRAIPENAVLDPDLRAGPQGVEDWTDLGIRLLRRNAHDAALSAFARAMVADGVSRRSVLGASSAMHGLGRLGQARRLMESAVRLWPEDMSVRNNLGVLYHAQGRDIDAARELRVAMALGVGAGQNGATALRVRDNLGMVLTSMDLARGPDAPLAPPAPTWDVATLGAGHYALIAAERID